MSAIKDEDNKYFLVDNRVNLFEDKSVVTLTLRMM